jgi:hypothetical protein
MRFVRNEIQTPKKLVTPEDRKLPAFKALMTGLGILALGAAMFFLAFVMRNYIKENWTISFRTIQTYGLIVSFVGVVIYLLAAKALKVPYRNTTFYKLTTIVNDELYEPQRKGDYTKSITARLAELDDKWSIMTQVGIPGTDDAIIPQVAIGPGGVFAFWPLSEHPDRKAFKNPGPAFEKASNLLGDALGVTVTPIMIFSTSKILQMYKKKCDPVTRVLTLMDLEEFFEKRKKKLSDVKIAELEAKVFEMIKGTPPGEKFWE